MRKLILSIVALLLCVPAYGQVPMTGAGLGVPAASASYTGPCDVSGVSCVGYYAVQMCANAAYSGSVSDIVDSATGTTTGTRLQCSGGIVSELISASACTFVTGNACSPLATTCAVACSLAVEYNQLGTGTSPNLNKSIQLSQKPTVVTSALNSKACAFSSAGSQELSALSTLTLAQPFTISGVAERSSGTALGRIFSDEGGSNNYAFRAANQVGFGGGVVVQTATDANFHALSAIFNSSSSVMVVDGVAGTAGTSTQAFSGSNVGIFSDQFTTGTGSGIIGYICEQIIVNTALNSTQYGALNSNMHSRWGF